MLEKDKIAICQQYFSLTYHVNFAFWCQNEVGFQDKDVLEVGGSLPQKFVFEYLGVRHWSAVTDPEYHLSAAKVAGSPYKGTAFKDVVHGEPSSFSFYDVNLEDYNLFLGKIEDLPIQYYERYDLVFSIAAFEHIHKLPQALEKMYFSLRPGGKLFSIFSPIWSAHDGHHLPLVKNSDGDAISRVKNCPIPPWGHLIMRPPELCSYLYGRVDSEIANLISYYTYNFNHINRFFLEDYVRFFQQSPFSIDDIQPVFPSSIPSAPQRRLQKLYPGMNHFKFNGLKVILSKSLDKGKKPKSVVF